MAAAEAGAKSISWWRETTKDQWYAFGAAGMGWVLDSLDFTVFLLIMVPISKEFNVPLTDVAIVFTLTLWMRLVGAVASGWLADRVGRKLPLMISILGYSLCNFIAGFSPTFWFLLLFRALLGAFMGAEWPAGAALSMETWPRRSRGFLGGVVGGRLSDVERDLRPIVQLHRLARHAVDGHPAGAFGGLCALPRQGAADLGGKPPAAARREPRDAHAALQYLQAGNAVQHLDRVLVDGGRLCPLLLGPGAVSNAPAKGSGPEPGDARDADHDRQRCRPSGCRVLGMGRRSLQPPRIDDHSRRLVDSPGILLPADRRLHSDGGRLCHDGSVRRRRYGRPGPGLSQRAVSDRNPRHRHGVLLPPGGDLRRAR